MGISPEYRIKLQETADNLRIPIFVTPDGGVYQLRPGAKVPLGAELFKPIEVWRDPDHGSASANDTPSTP